MEKKYLQIRITIPTFGTRPNVGLVREYTRALKAEIEATEEELQEYSIGLVHIENASKLGEQNLTQLILSLRKLGLADPKIEKTASLAPDRTNAAVLIPLRNFHNDLFRFDLGSLNPVDFSDLNRPYSIKDYSLLFRLLEACEMHNFCVELNIGLPRQTKYSLSDCLNQTLERDPDHVALIPTDKNTPENRAELFELADRFLQEHGYEKNSVYEYAKPGTLSRGIAALGEDPDIWGFGLGAVSHLDGCILKNTMDWSVYLEHSDDPEQTIVQCVRPDESSQARSRLLHGLQSVHGLDRMQFEQEYGGHYAIFFDDLLAQGSAEKDGEYVRLTDYGIANSLSIWKKLEGENKRETENKRIV